MRPHQVDVGLWDGSHTDLIISTAEERSKRAGKYNVAIPAGSSDAHTHEILFGNEALDVAVWEGISEFLGVSGILCVAVHGDDSVIVLSDLHKGRAVSHTCGNLKNTK